MRAVAPGLAILLLVAGWTQAAGEHPKTTWHRYVHTSQLDAAFVHNHPAIVAEARLALLGDFAAVWLAAGTDAADRRARHAAIKIARTRPSAFVSMDVLQAPFQPLGDNGAVIVHGMIDLPAVQRLHAEQLARVRAAPRYLVLSLVSEYNQGSRCDFAKTEIAVQGVLARAGHNVVSGRQLETIRKRKLDYAKLDHADHVLRSRIALDEGADIIIAGSVYARHAFTEPIAGRDTALYSVDCQLEIVWADTGLAIDAITSPPGRKTFPSAEEALAHVANDIAKRCVEILADQHRVQQLKVVVDGVEFLEKEELVRGWLQVAVGSFGLPPGVRSGNRLTLHVQTMLDPFQFQRTAIQAARASDSLHTLVAGERSAGEVEFRLELR